MEQAVSKVSQYVCCISHSGEDHHEEKRLLFGPEPLGFPQGYEAMRSVPYYSATPKMVALPPTDELDSQAETAESIGKSIIALQNLDDVHHLKHKIEHAVTAFESWSEWLAKKVFDKILAAFEADDSSTWGDIFRGAVEKAKEVFKKCFQWLEDHPYYATAIAAIIVFGILVLVCPSTVEILGWVLDTVGFEEVGPVEGSWAAKWQASYDGLVLKKSMFSYFQRLGMIRRKWLP